MKTNRKLGAVQARRGMTLIELMIAVAIVAIIGAVAMPAYNSYVVRTKRAAASACLMQQTQFMERVYATNMRYDQNNGVATALPGGQCQTDLNNIYTISFPTGQPTSTTFTVQAVPQGTQASRDTKCATLTINQANAKGISGSGSVADCWR